MNELLRHRFEEITRDFFFGATFGKDDVKSLVKDLDMTYKEFASFLGVSEIKIKRTVYGTLPVDPILQYVLNRLYVDNKGKTKDVRET